jgi:DNA ligase 1
MPEYQRWKGIMKAYPFEERRLAKWNPPYIVQPKYDGIRCRAVPLQTGVNGDEYLLLSSEENILFSVPHLNRIISDRIKPRVELDGELYCHGMSFEQITSITSRTVNIHPDAIKIQYHIFDIIVDGVPQIKRLITLESLRGVSPWLVVAPFHICGSLDEVLKAYDSIISQGYEGIIVRHTDAPYERKRSTWVMKFKPKQEDDYEIVGSVEEVSIDGNPKDRLGALVCKSGDGNLFNVGTGFTDEQREQLWSIRDILPGEIAKVKYQHITSGKAVPRFPVFVEVKYNV